MLCQRGAGTFWGVLQVLGMQGDDRPPLFEDGEFISEGFGSPFEDMLENLWFWLKFWLAATRLLAGEEIVTWWSPVPLFLVFGWAPTPRFPCGYFFCQGEKSHLVF